MLIDAHVHLLPDRLARAIRDWLEKNLWHLEYQAPVEECLRQLAAWGAERVVTLPYAHKPGMARDLNFFTAELMRRNETVWGLGTVFPGEPQAERILDEALGPLGLRGIKIHCHVMKVAPDDPVLAPVWRAAAAHDRPVVIHAGREPASRGYGIDVHTVSGAQRVRRVLDQNPEVTVLVPHLGASEVEAFEGMLGEYPRLHLDTTMALSNCFPVGPDLGVIRRWPERILFGTDFPHIPYPWNRELGAFRELGLAPADEERVLGGNAARLFGPR